MKKILFLILLLTVFKINSQTLISWYPTNPSWTSSNPSVNTLNYQGSCYGYVSTSDCTGSGSWNVYNNSQITSYTSPLYNFTCSSNLVLNIQLDINLGDRNVGNANTVNHFDWLYFQYSINNGTTWVNPVLLNTRGNGSGVNLSAYNLGTNNRNGWTGAVGSVIVNYSIPASTQLRFRFIFASDGSVNTYNGNTNIYYADILVFNLSCPSSLPIELLYFTGKKNSCGSNNLVWSTATESNNKNFDVERSIDGVTFIKIGEINGAGNSTSIKTYSFNDNNPNSELNYYRLKQNDYDGEYTYSDLISIDNTCENSIKIIKICNLLGQEVGETYTGVIFIYRSDNTIVTRFQNAN